jgi:hypothetical protein
MCGISYNISRKTSITKLEPVELNVKTIKNHEIELHKQYNEKNTRIVGKEARNEIASKINSKPYYGSTSAYHDSLFFDNPDKPISNEPALRKIVQEKKNGTLKTTTTTSTWIQNILAQADMAIKGDTMQQQLINDNLMVMLVGYQIH